MENKIIEKGVETQNKIINGVTKAANAVKTTLGPSGRCVAIHTNYGVDVSRDGVTVAKSLKFKDPHEDIGAYLLKKAAENTERQCGDATSTTAVLIEALCKRGQRALQTGANVNEIKSGMLKAEEYIKEYISTSAIKIDGDLEKIRKVATISANNDPEVGDMVVKIMQKIGTGATITADLSSSLDTVIDVVSGMKIERGWCSPAFITNQKTGECILDDAYVVVIGERVSSIQQLIPLLESLQKTGAIKPILFVVDDMDESVIQNLAFNVVRGALSCCVIKGIDFGDGRKNLMQDIATMTGAVHFCPENGNTITQADITTLGKANKVVISRDSTIITEGYGNPDEIAERAEILKAKLDQPGISDYDKVKFEKRLSNLTGGIGVIKAGGASEVEKQNRKATIEDAILASRSAISEGCVPGSGYIFYKAALKGKSDSKFLKSMQGDEISGAMIVFDSLPVIMKTIAENSGVSGDVVLSKVASHPDKKGPWGFNAKTKKYGNLMDEGILDSAKVLRVSLENSVSTASMILLTDCTIVDEPEKECKCGGEQVETGEF